MKKYILPLLLLSTYTQAALLPQPEAPEFKVITVDTHGEPYRCEGNAIITKTDYGKNLTTLKYFGTSISINIYGENSSEKIMCNALHVIQKYHYLASNYSTYPHVTNVKTINNTPAEKHIISPELTAMIQESIEWYKKSDGYFNIALSPVIDLWRGYRAQCKGETKRLQQCGTPTEIELINAAKLVNINNIQLDKKENTIQMKTGMSIDLGGIAKGWMAEMVYRQLKKDGVKNFMINAGGNIRHYGFHPQGREFTTAIENPICKKYNNELARCQTLTEQYHEIITGKDLTLVSSGNYLRYYLANGKEYHHLINPKTLKPKRTGISTTVIMNNNQIYADIISTMLFLMPYQQSLDYVNSNPGIEAVWYLTEDGIKMESNGFDRYRLKVAD
ncbi:ApbE-like lipoprotein [Shewanella piezotolerans WP3]|uniref:FAD:protein FMN transferase n=1 Tax=Shewanella piezotolerans (strain WP3 / JCM 13877) TaxID=225849 RepID=B8CP11_SHEPW|nr:FAD:protein FMN transferase [Shewanella piezotolerans]ACJ29255.1 ApbE-like lipoprotein [Shewanella piezotolerans WP3]